MCRKLKNILWGIIGIMLLGTCIYAGTGLKMSFEEAQQKKENREKPETSGKKYQAMSKEQWKSMSADEKYKYQMKQFQAEAEKEAPGNLEYIKREFEKGTLLPPADTSILKLGGAKYKPALPLLIDILKNYNVTDIRVSAAEALGNIDDSAAIPALIEALGYKDYQIQVEAAVALVKLGQADEAFPVLAKVVQKEDIENWDVDVESRLGNYPESIKNQKRQEYKERFKNKSLPSKAVRYLGEIGSEPALNIIEKGLDDPNEFVRLQAGSILMETERKNIAIPVLEQIIENHVITRSVRSSAMFAIASGKGDEERKILEKYSKSKDEYIAKKARKAIKRLEDK